jgi:phospholipase/carboxylesterase
MPELLKTVEVETGGKARGAVIWLHGLGADGHDFEPIVPHLGLNGLGVRFVFPHAPRRAVSLNMGLVMPAWFDVRDLEFRGQPDFPGLRQSAGQVEALIAREVDRGVPPAKIALAGFSQGGAVALHVALCRKESLAGVVALSTFFIEDPEAPLDEARRDVPIFQAHGSDDPMIHLSLGRKTGDLLASRGFKVAFKTYPMQHEVCPEEIADIGDFLRSLYA